MDYPFYPNRFQYPHSSSYYDTQQYPYYYSKQVPVEATTAPSKKVVSIPVTDGLGRPSQPPASRLDSAVKIQKVFRGFLVRKSVKRIGEIQREVNEIEKRISMEETVELVRKDSKERLKVNEMLMRLLLKLDSVRGVDSGVRDFRKAVIKKAISLQEMVDSIVAVEENRDLNNADDGADQTLETSHDDDVPPPPSPNCDELGAVVNSDSNAVDSKQELLMAVPCDICVSNLSEQAEAEELSEVKENANGEEENASECAENMEMSSQADSSASLIEGDDGGECNVSLEMPVNVDDGNGENEVGDDGKDQSHGNDGGEENKLEEAASGKNRELLEKMVEDNEKMMGLMAQLFERNEMQTRLLSSLSQRVDQLERALMCERSKRNKKKRNSAGVADCLESTQDNKKPGKRL